jgi:cyclopropane fatty-acyl-phospholipid synthase-like methyltransferase
MTKPYAESCEQNQDPILQVLKAEFADRSRVLEIGSGTGQHAIYFGARLPHLTWQTSDMAANHAGIHAWLEEAGLDNVLPPIELDVRSETHWPEASYDAVFSANAVHIMGWDAVEALFEGLGRVMENGARLALYGPFNYGGQYTSESNARFDQWLKDRDAASGIRNFEDLDALARAQGLGLHRDHAMPANNRILVWIKE